MTPLEYAFGTMCALAALATIGITAIVLLRWRDNRHNPDGYITPAEERATAKRIHQITNPTVALEQPTVVLPTRPRLRPARPVGEPHLAPVPWHLLPADPDLPTPLADRARLRARAAGEPTPLAGTQPHLDDDVLSFTAQWRRDELDERIRQAELRAAQAGLVTR